MTPEEKSLLERTYALAEENNRLLKAIKKSSRWKTGLQIGYWALIIILSFGGVYFFQMYMNSITEASSGGTGQNQSFTQELQQALGQ
jgi:hypothetical protein